MRKIQRMSIGEFINRQEVGVVEKLKSHIKRNQSFYLTVGGMTVCFLFFGIDGSASAASDIDARATVIYRKLIAIGKWIVIVKAGFDVIQSATSGDFGSVKTKLVGYIITFLTLLGLPWAFDEIEGLFS